MHSALAIAIVVAFVGCRGEPVPRDYRNHPPAMTHPVDSKDQAPSQHGMGAATPETGTGGEGQTLQPVVPGTTTPATTTATTTTPPARNPEAGAPENTTRTSTQ